MSIAYKLKTWRRWARGWAGNWRARTPRQLRLCETLALGDRRFLAVVQFEQQKFLVGGAGNSIALLTRLGIHDGEAAPFADVMEAACAEPDSHQKHGQKHKQ
jgi:flagellar biogenesis protein FliO